MGIVEEIFALEQGDDALVVFALLVEPMRFDRINFRTALIATSLCRVLCNCLSILSSVVKPPDSSESSPHGLLRFNFDTPEAS